MIRNQRGSLRMNTPVGKAPSGVPIATQIGTNYSGHMGPMGGLMVGNMGGYMGPMSGPPVQTMGGTMTNQIGSQPGPRVAPPVGRQPAPAMTPPATPMGAAMVPPMATQLPPQQTGIAGGFQGNGMGPADQRQMLAAILANGSMGNGMGPGNPNVLAPMAPAPGPAINTVLGSMLARRGQ